MASLGPWPRPAARPARPPGVFPPRAAEKRGGGLDGFGYSRRLLLALLGGLLAVGLGWSDRSLAADAADQPPLRVGIYDHSGGSAKGPQSLRRFLTDDVGVSCRSLTPEEIRQGRLAEVDVLIMPGGSGSKQSKMLEESGREAIREFVRDGGGYVGICAGAYLASAHYSWSLHLINAQVVDREHWARGTGTCTLEFTPLGQQTLGEPSPRGEVYYGQGPLLAPYDKEELPSYETLAEYASEIAKKGAPRGVMIGTTAIARAPFGAGRVICFSPHPEKSSGPNHWMLHGVLWAGGRELPVLTTPLAQGISDED